MPSHTSTNPGKPSSSRLHRVAENPPAPVVVPRERKLTIKRDREDSLSKLQEFIERAVEARVQAVIGEAVKPLYDYMTQIESKLAGLDILICELRDATTHNWRYIPQEARPLLPPRFGRNESIQYIWTSDSTSAEYVDAQASLVSIANHIEHAASNYLARTAEMRQIAGDVSGGLDALSTTLSVASRDTTSLLALSPLDLQSDDELIDNLMSELTDHGL